MCLVNMRSYIITCYKYISYMLFAINTGPRERSQDFLLNVATIPNKRDHSGETAADELDLPLFDLSSLLIATDNFSNANKLGQGGFGCVYKVNKSI